MDAYSDIGESGRGGTTGRVVLARALRSGRAEHRRFLQMPDEHGYVNGER